MANTGHYKIWQCKHTKPLLTAATGFFKGIFTYDEELGDEEEGFEPGTRLEDIPDNWCCPDCGQNKKLFVELE